MKIVSTFAEVRQLASGAVSHGLVPTLGYLHDGHVALFTGAAAQCDWVTASLFVNPLQFAPDEDLAAYPRNLERDAAIAESAGVDVLFVPDLFEIYPDGAATRVTVEALATGLEGASRPSHFEGVATVVTVLLAGTGPDRAYFGRKDAQQLAIIRRLVADLAFPLTVVPVSTVRETDGLALSSRNAYLSEPERAAALSLSAGLMAAADAAEAGERSAATLEALVWDRLAQEALVEPDYATLSDAVRVIDLPRLDREAFLAVAARVGATRLIDNVHFEVTEDGTVTADRGVRLDGPSLMEV